MDDVKMVSVNDALKAGESRVMLPGEIPGATVYLHALGAGERKTFAALADRAVILMSVDGAYSFSSGGKTVAAEGRYVFVPGCGRDADVQAQTATRMLEIQWEIPADGRAAWATPEREFPYVQEYFAAVQYRDPNKSDKTISRELVRQRVVPGFCMGSVESYGYDKVAQHPHPMLDQFFFSFPENDVDVLIDDFKVPMQGDTLLHIPLGSNHGVEVHGDKHMHYIWIDFFLGQAGLERLDRSHKPTGTMRSFK